MKAHLHSARIAPKKANLIAMMVRGMRVNDALTALARTNKKAARLVQDLLLSAVANAHHNDKQHRENLMIKTIVVNQGTSLRRGVPMARGRMRPMNKFMSHISITLGIFDADEKSEKSKRSKKNEKNVTKDASQHDQNAVKSVSPRKVKKTEISPSS